MYVKVPKFAKQSYPSLVAIRVNDLRYDDVGVAIGGA